jgi:hypothetical protein
MKDIDDLAEWGFAVDQIKLECLSEGVWHNIVSSYKKAAFF